MVPPGIAAEPLEPFAIDVLVESKVASGLAHEAAAQTWKVTLPVSLESGSAKVAVSVGVPELSCAPLAGETSAGVEGAASAVLLVTETPDTVAAAFPAGSAVSRTIGFDPGFVYESASTSRWCTALASENVSCVADA